VEAYTPVMARPRSLLRASLATILATGMSWSVSAQASDVVGQLPWSHLAAAKLVTVQRIAGPPADSCRPDLVASSDTIACYPALRVERAPQGKWVVQLLDLLSQWDWVMGKQGAHAKFDPALGVHFQGDSLNVDWVLSFEPFSTIMRVGGKTSAWAVVPTAHRLPIFELMRRAFGDDHQLVARYVLEERQQLKESGQGDTEAWRGSRFPQRSSLGPEVSLSYEGCDCADAPRVHGPSPCFDLAPRITAAPPPTYPEFAKEALIQGRVFLHVLIGSNGRVEAIKVFRGITGLNDAAVDAVRSWTWEPARRADQAVCAWIEVPVDFHF